MKSFLRHPAVRIGAAGTVFICTAAALLTGYVMTPHATVAISDESMAVAPDGGIEDTVTVTVTNTGIAPIQEPVIGMRRDSRLLSSCRGSLPLTQSGVNRLTDGRRVAPLGPGIDLPSYQPDADWFVRLPAQVILPGESARCRLTYEFQGEPDEAELIAWTGVVNHEIPVMSAGSLRWNEPYPPVSITVTDAQTIRVHDPDNPGTLETVTLQINQPGAAEYEMTVHRAGLPDAAFDITCDGQAVTTTSGTSGYLALNGPTTCEVSYEVTQKPVQASVGLKFFATQRKPVVEGNPSWREL